MMEYGYKKIFWGFLITLFDFNLGPVNILPDFIGYFIIGSGIYKLYEEFESKNFKIANSLANFLMCYSLFMSVLDYGFSNHLIGTDLNSHPIKIIIDMVLSIFVSSLFLIMAFNIISGTIDLYLKTGQNIEACSLEKTQRNYTVLFIIGLIFETISLNISNEYFIFAAVLYSVTAILYFTKIVSSIRKTIRAKE